MYALNWGFKARIDVGLKNFPMTMNLRVRKMSLEAGVIQSDFLERIPEEL